MLQRRAERWWSSRIRSPAKDWSTATLEGFCESLAPLRPA